MTAQVVLVVVGWCAGWLLLGPWPRLTSRGCSRAGAPSRSIAVVVPLRNEEANLASLLATLEGQRQVVEHLVVVDDGSTDSTPMILAAWAERMGADERSEIRVDVITGAAPPAGWVGKSWALHQGMGVIESDTVVMVDADVHLATNGARLLVDELERRGGLVSIAPFHVVVKPIERISALFNLVAVMGAGPGWPGRRGSSWAANGACIVCGVDDYRRVGGHAADPGSVVEDLALAARFRGAGEPVAMLGSDEGISYRMYSSGRDLVEGWSKNLAAGAGRTPLPATLAVFLWITALLTWPVLLLEGRAVAAAIAYGAFALQLVVQLRRVGRFGSATALLHPVLAVAFVGIFLRSLVLLARGRARWRGRDVVVGRRSGPA